VTFEGNANTDSMAAISYAYIAASEYCYDRRKIPSVRVPQNNSTTSTHTQINSYQVGKQTHYYSTPVNQRFPKFTSSFICMDKARYFDGVIDYSELSREALGNSSPDFRGGVLIESISPEVESKFRKDDVILSVAGDRVEKLHQVLDVLSRAELPDPEVKVLRNKKPLTFKAKVTDNSANVMKLNQGVVKSLCEKLKVELRPAYCGINARAMSDSR
jgi:hypothetical protein